MDRPQAALGAGAALFLPDAAVWLLTISSSCWGGTQAQRLPYAGKAPGPGRQQRGGVKWGS